MPISLGVGLGLSARRIGVGVSLASDTFTRADSAVSLGSTESPVLAWSALVGTWGISTNRAYNVAATNNAVAVVTTAASDVTVSATMAVLSAANTAGVAVRCSDGSNFIWVVGYTAASSNVLIVKRVAGADTVIATLTSPSALANGDVLSAVCSGNTITARINGVTVGSATDAFNNTAVKHGLTCGAGDATIRWDNFSITTP